MEYGPLLRVRLQRLAPDRHLLTFTAHHIVMDGWSLWLFCRDLGHLYDAEVSGKPAGLPEGQSYREYVETMTDYEQSEASRQDAEFWMEPFTEDLPTLHLPTDRPRPSLKTFSGSRYDHVIDADLVAALRAAGGKAGCSLFHTLLAAFEAFLCRVTGQSDVCVGIPAAGQNATDLPEVMGHCVNSLPIRSHVDTGTPFIELARQVRGRVLDAMDHQRFTFGSLLRKLSPPRDPSRPPIIQVMFNIDPELNSEELGFAGLEVTVSVEPRMRENFEWFINGVLRQDGALELQCQYNTDLFDPESMAETFESFESFLVDAAKSPTAASKDLRLLSHRQAKRTIVEWNDTEFAYPSDATVHQEVSRQAAATPDQVAVTFGSTQITYAELDRRANQLAHQLQARSVRRGDLVGVCLERSEHLPAALLAVMKCGAGYVPLDPSYPSERLKYMCEHSGLKIVVTSAALRPQVLELGPAALVLEEAISSSAQPPQVQVQPSDIAYVIYTSGSTGKPKGVRVPHGAVVNFLYSMGRTPGFDASDRLLAVTTPSFDISVLELFLPLIHGAQVVIADETTLANGQALGQRLEESGITVLQATPATWRLLIDSGWSGREGLRAFCGGEPMPADLVRPLLQRVDELWNLYGPTETTVWSSAFRVREPDLIRIGKPIGNTQIYVLDEHRQPVPIGVAGEVFIGGAGVTQGYLNREDLTAERFVDNPYFNPFAEYVNHRLYRTGDLARWRHEGELEFLRRNDKQVKVRGFRIELEEIEHRLREHPGIAQAIVTVHDQSGDARLVAYMIHDAQAPTASELRDHLRQTLPHYMIPQHFVELDSFPKTNNGKLDYKSLPAPDGVGGSDAEFVAPESYQETLLAQLWCEALGVESVGINDNFFSLGGHSLLVIRVIARVEEETGFRLSPQDFLMGSLEQLARQLPAREPKPMVEEPREAAAGLLAALRGLWSS